MLLFSAPYQGNASNLMQNTTNFNFSSNKSNNNLAQSHHKNSFSQNAIATTFSLPSKTSIKSERKIEAPKEQLVETTAKKSNNEQRKTKSILKTIPNK